MQISLTSSELGEYVSRQMTHFFPDRDVDATQVNQGLGVALERLEYCLDRLRIKYARAEGQSRFNHLNTDQYATFLYYLSHALFRAGEIDLAEKAYALNKALHAIDAFYEVELPNIFLLQHPVGTVLGRGTFADYLVVYQRCSVGSDLEGNYPVFREGVVMFGGSAVIGACEVGENAWLSVGTLVMNCNVPSNSIVFGSSPHLVFKPTRRNARAQMFAAAD